MKGYEVIVCNTCNTQFSACVKQYIDIEWKEEVREYTKNGKARLEEVDKCNLDSPVNPCCGDTSTHDINAMKAIEKLRDHLVKESSKINSGFPKTNTKKFKYWEGYSDAVVAIDNYILILSTPIVTP